MELIFEEFILAILRPRHKIRFPKNEEILTENLTKWNRCNYMKFEFREIWRFQVLQALRKWVWFAKLNSEKFDFYGPFLAKIGSAKFSACKVFLPSSNIYDGTFFKNIQ